MPKRGATTGGILLGVVLLVSVFAGLTAGAEGGSIAHEQLANQSDSTVETTNLADSGAVQTDNTVTTNAANQNLSFPDQQIDNGNVNVTNVQSDGVASTVLVTFTNGGDVVVSGLSEGTFNNENVSVSLGVDDGFPNQYTAHILPSSNTSQQYQPGDPLSSETVNNITANETATINDSDGGSSGPNQNLSFPDQQIDSGSVTVTDVQSDGVSSSLLVTYESGGQTVTAGLAGGTFDNENVSVNLDFNDGFPNQYTAHILPSADLSQQYNPGDILSTETTNNIIANETATINGSGTTPDQSLNFSDQELENGQVVVENVQSDGVESDVIVHYTDDSGDEVIAGIATGTFASENVTVDIGNQAGVPGEHTASILPSTDKSQSYAVGDRLSLATKNNFLDNASANVSPFVPNQSLSFPDQELNTNENVTVVDVQSDGVTSAVIITFEDGGQDVITGFSAGTFNNENVSVDLSFNDGFPNQYTAHILPSSDLSQQYQIGDSLSTETTNNIAANETATINDSDANENPNQSLDFNDQQLDNGQVVVENVQSDGVESGVLVYYTDGSGNEIIAGSTLGTFAGENVSVDIGSTSGVPGNHTASIVPSSDVSQPYAAGDTLSSTTKNNLLDNATANISGSPDPTLDSSLSNLDIAGDGQNTKILEGDDEPVSVTVENTDSQSGSFDVTLDIKEGGESGGTPVSETQTTGTLAPGETETVTFTGVTDSLSPETYIVNMTTASDFINGTLVVEKSADMSLSFSDQEPTDTGQITINDVNTNNTDGVILVTYANETGDVVVGTQNVNVSQPTDVAVNIDSIDGLPGQHTAWILPEIQTSQSYSANDILSTETEQNVLDSDTANLDSFLTPANFNVSIANTNSPIVENNTLSVTFDVANEGQENGTQDVTLDAGPLGTNSTSVFLEAGVSTTETLTLETGPGDAGNYTATVSSDNDSASTSVTVENPANFAVTIDGTNSPVIAGDVLSVNATIENTGDVTGTQTVEFDAGALGNASRQIGLDSGNSTTESVSFATSEGDAGDYTATVSTANDSASTSVRVDEPANFSVSIADTNSPVVAGDELLVNATITNTGVESAEQTINLTAAGLGTSLTTVTLGGGQSTTESIPLSTESGDAGTYTANVSSADDSAETSVTVQLPAESALSGLDIAGQGADAAIDQGDDESVSVTVENVGEAPDSFNVTLTVDDEVNQTQSTSDLSGGQTETVVFENVTGELNPGDYGVEMNTSNDTATGTLTVNQSATSSLSNLDIAPPNATITEGEDANVSVDVTNTGDLSGSFDVTLNIGSTVTQTQSTSTLAGEENETIVFEDVTSGLTGGEYNVDVSTDDDSRSGTLTVEAPAESTLSELNIAQEGTDATITEGVDENVSVLVENIGNKSGTFDVTLEIGNAVTQTQTTSSLAGGANETVVFESVTGGLSAGNYSVDVNTSDDAASGSLTVESPASSELSGLDIVGQGASATITEGDDGNVSVSVTNTGDQSGFFDVTLEIGNAVTQSKLTNTLASGESQTIVFDGVTDGLSAGSYSVDVNTSDDAVSGSLTVEAPPESSVSGLDIGGQGASATITEGDDESVSVDVANTGGQSASFNVTLEIGTAVTQTKSTSSLAGGANETIVFENVTGGLSADNYTVDVNTSDDALTGSLTVEALASSSVSGLDIAGQGTDATITEGDNESVSATVENVGDLSGSFTVTLEIGNAVTETQSTSTLAGGTSETVVFENVTGNLGADGYDVSVSTADDLASGNLTVQLGDVETVEISPNTDQTITAGETVNFSATAFDGNGNVVEDNDSAFDWSAGSGAISTDGVFSETTAGDYGVTAALSGVTSSSSPTVTVEIGDVDTVELDPASAQTATAGTSLNVSATALDAFGNVNESSDAAFTWSAEGANITGSGVFNETAAGTYNVTAAIDGVTSAATTVTVEPADTASVQISPNTDQTITAGDTVEFSATASDQYGNLVTDNDTAFSWSAEGGTITSSGTFEETSVGAYDVTAVLEGVASAATTVTVEIGDVDTVELDPASAQTATAGTSLDVSATALDAFGNVNESSDAAFTWSAEGANITGSGVFNETAAGTYNVTAAIDGVTSAPTAVTVEPASVDSVELDPSANQTIAVGETVEFSAQAFDQYNNPAEDNDSAFTWDAQDGSISGDGLFDETTAGDYDVRATLDGVTSAVTTVTVEKSDVASVEISPNTAQSITAGDTVNFSATAFDAGDNVVEDNAANFTWSAEGGSITGSGVFDETTAGTYNVTATIDGVTSAPTPVTVGPTNVDSVEISPSSSQTVSAGAVLDFSAAAFDQYGNLITDTDSDFDWTAANSTGAFNETNLGTFSVNAAFNSVSSQSVNVTVEVGSVDSVELDPSSAQTITAGNSTAISATAFDAFGNVNETSDAAFTWNASGGSITGSGTFDETAAGAYDVTAAIDGATSAATTVTVEPAGVASVTLSPSEAQTVAAGTSLAFSAEALDQYGNLITDTGSSFDWTGTDGAGTFQETTPGTYTVNASYNGVFSQSVNVTVEPADVDSVELDPSTDQTITAGDTVTFSATALDAYGNVNETSDAAFTWNASGGSITGSGTFDETTAGSYDVTATLDGVTSSPATVTVETQSVDTVEITPSANQTVKAGDSVEFSAAAFDQYGNLITDSDSEFNWTGTDNIGTFEETTPGTYTVETAFNGVTSQSVAVTVENASVDSVQISPSTDQNITSGETVAFSAAAFDEFGNPVTDTDSEFTWAASGGSINGSGTFDETAAGTYDVTATLSGVTSSPTTVAVEQSNVASVEISPSTAQTTTAGDTVAFSATAFDASNNIVDDTDANFTWDAESGSINTSGAFNETTAGTYNVTATLDGVSSAPTTVTVEPASVIAVEISPSTDQTVTPGETVNFSATAVDLYGNTVEDSDSEFSWLGTDSTGTFQQTDTGTYSVFASYSGESSQAVEVTVEQGDVDSVEISPSGAQTVTAGTSTDFSAAAYDASGNLITDTDGDFNWTGTDSTGTFAETSAGTYAVQVSYEGVSSQSVDVTVEPAGIDNVTLDPAGDQTITAGGSVEFTAAAFDQYGNLVTDNDSTFSWGAQGGSISDDGLFTETSAAQTGTDYDVTAAIDGVTSSPTTVTVEPASVDSVTLSPSADQTVTAGTSTDFSASAFDQYGNLVEDNDSAFLWDAEAGSIRGDGLFNETSAGTYNVTATLSGVTSAATTVTVEAGDVATVEIDPSADQTVTAGDSVEFTAAAYDASGNLLTDTDSEFNWTGTDGTGTFTEASAGTYTVRALYNGVSSQSVNVTVEPTGVETVEISPSGAQTVTAGNSTDFSAAAYDASGNLITDTDSDFNWTGTNSTGTFTETSAGTYTVQVSYQGVSSQSVDVTVEPAAVDSVTLDPAGDQSILSGGSIDFAATARDAFDNLVEGADSAFTWDAEGGSINGTGLFDETATGTYNVTATYDGETAVPTQVTVLAEGAFTVDQLSTNDPIEGEDLTVSFQVENTGDVEETQTVELTTDPDIGSASTSVTLAAGASTNETLAVGTAAGDAGSYTVTVAADNATASTSATVRAPANFSVSSADTNAPITAGETLSVDATIENTGDVTATQTVTLDAGALGSTSTSVTLGGSVVTTETLTLGTGAGDAGNYTATVSTENDSVSTDVQVIEPANFSASIQSTTTPIVEGDTLSVDATIENTGEASATQTVTLDAGALGSTSTSVALDGGASTTETLTLGTEVGDAGNYTATVSTANDSASTSVTVQAPANFAVTLGETNAPVVAGETLSVNATIENTGDLSATQTVTLDVGSLGSTLASVTLDSGASTTETLTLGTDAGDAGTYTATVSTADDNASTSVTVQALANFSVSIADTNAPIVGGQGLSVDVDIENVGDLSATQTVTLDAGALGSTSTSVLLAGGTSTTETLTLGTSAGDAGNYTATVSTENDSASTDVRVQAPANFSVSIADTNAPIAEGDQLSVDAAIENTGELSATQTVALDVGPLGSTSTSVTLAGGASTTETFTLGTGDGDAGSYTATVSTANDSAATSVTVSSLTNFSVTLGETNAPVVEGDTLSVNATIENVGDLSDTQTVTLDVGALGSTSSSVSLNGGASTTETFALGTSAGDAGTYTATVSTANDTASTSVTVQAPANLSVSLAGTNAPVVAGEALSVDAAIENTGEVSATQTVTLDAGALGNTSTSVTLAGGASTTETLTLGTQEGDAGTYTASVSTANDSASTNVTVQAPANFAVTIPSTNAPIEAGDELSVNATIENVGDLSATQTVTVDVGPLGSTSTSVNLAGGVSTTETFTLATSTGDGGNYTATVSTANDTATANVTVEVSEAALTFGDQNISEAGTVTVENVTSAGAAARLLVTYSQGGDRVVAGVANGTFDSENVTIELAEDIGYPDNYTVHLVPEVNVSGTYEPGDTVSDATLGAAVQNETATVTTTTGAPLIEIIAGSPAKDTTGDGLLNDIRGSSDFRIFDVQTLFSNLENPVVQDHARFFNFQGGSPDEVRIFDVQALFEQVP